MQKRKRNSANNSCLQLKKLLDHEEFGSEAAYALASFNPTHPSVPSVFENFLIIKATDGSDVVDLVAVKGLELLGTSGNDSVRASLQSAIPKLEAAIGLNEDNYADESIYCSLAILSIDPKNEKAIDSLLTGMRNSFWERDERPIEMAFKRIPAILATSSYLKNKLIEQLNAREVSIDWDTSPKVPELFKFEIHLQAAKMLASANLARAETTATLIELCEKGRGFDLVETQMALAKIRPTSPAAVEAIAKSLSDFSDDSSGGDFYGNGGISYTPSEKAAEALVIIGAPALDVLMKKTSDPFHLVRAQAVKAISSIQSPSAKSEAITKRLIELATDVSHRVRLEVVTALSNKEVARIKLAKRKGTDPTPNGSILAALEIASRDQRPHHWRCRRARTVSDSYKMTKGRSRVLASIFFCRIEM